MNSNLNLSFYLAYLVIGSFCALSCFSFNHSLTRLHHTQPLHVLQDRIEAMKMRAAGVCGPVQLFGSSSSLHASFQEQFYTVGTDTIPYRSNHISFGHSKDQVPEPFHEFMEYSDRFKSFWSENLILKAIELAKQRVDYSCKHYPFSVPDLYEAIDYVSVLDKRVLVGGSVSPWVEGAVLANGAKSVVTTDYVPLVIDSPLVEFKPTPLLLDTEGGKFDIIVSFSSIEHDGLGRYGDPLVPHGDKAAMAEFKLLLKRRGILILGIPVGEDLIDGNLHRIYGELRFRWLIEGWELVKTIDTHWGKKPWRENNWQNQPIFILTPVHV